VAGKIVQVISPEGEFGEVDEKDLAVAIKGGYRLASIVREEELQAEYGDSAGQLMAGVEGALRGLSLGGSDAAGAAITGGVHALTSDGGPRLTPEARQRMAELGIAAPEEDTRGTFARGYDTAREQQDLRREANPGIAMGSEVAGAVLPSLLTGGTSTLARGLQYTPAALASRAGAATALRVGGAAPGLARAGLAGLAGGAVEGGLAGLSVGASRLTSEQVQDPELAAEHILSSAGEGLLIGGGLGALFGTAARGLQVGAQKLEQRAAAARAAAGVPELPGPSPDFEGITFALEARPLTANALPEPPRGKWAAMAERAQAAQGGFDEAVQGGTRAIRQDFDEVLRGMDQIDEFGGIAAKQKANAFNVDGPVSTAEVDELLGGLEGDIATWMAGRSRQGLVSGGGLSAMEGVKKSLAENGKLIRSALQRGNVGEAYSLLDQGVKGFLGKARNSTRAAPVQDLIEGLYPRVQKFLESDELWGELAEKQRMANPAWADRITKSKDARVQPFTLVAGEKAANQWDNIRLANDGAIKGLLSQLGDAGSEATEQAFRTQLRGFARDATARTTAWGSPQLQREAVRVTNAVKRIEDRMDAVALLRRDAIAGQRQMQASSAELLASAAGVVAPPVGWAVSGVAQGGRRLLAAVGAAGAGTGARVAQSAAQLVRGASTAAAVGARQLPVVAGSQAPGMLAQDKHDAAIREAQELSHAGSPATQALIQQAAEIEQEDPALADAYASRQLQRASFIASKLPQNTSVAIFAPKPVLDPVTDRSLRRSVAAAYEPAAALERISNALGSAEDVEALKKLYPAMYNSFVQQVRGHLEQMPEPPDYQTRLRIAAATDLVTDPSLEPLSIARAQQAATLPDQTKAGEAQAAQTRQARRPGGRKFGAGRDQDNVYAPLADQILTRR
jgi:hypothetical protein